MWEYELVMLLLVTDVGAGRFPGSPRLLLLLCRFGVAQAVSGFALGFVSGPTDMDSGYGRHITNILHSSFHA